MKAVVMAGGEGTRLRPLTCGIPKPMVPVGNRPIIDHVLGLLNRHGFEEAILTLHHRPQAIIDHVGDGSAFGLACRHFIEDIPLGTAGSVKNVEDDLDGSFLVISGDVLTDIDLGALVAFHREKGAAATIALTSVETPLEYGVVVRDKDGRVRRLIEKPGWGEVVSDQVNTGIYVVEPEVLSLIEPGKPFDFSRQLFPALLEAGKPVFGYATTGYWCDVGNLTQYLQSHVDILEGRTHLDIGALEERDKIWLGQGVELAKDVDLKGPVLIGPGSYVGAGARIEGPVVIGRDVVVAGQASLKRSVVGDRSYVGRLAEVRGAILGRGVRLGNRASVYDGAVLADEVRVGEETTVKPGVKVWPGRTVAPETVLGESLVWGQAWGYGLFGESGVQGTVNVDLRPEIAARLGAAFGASLPPGASVAVAVDPAPASRLIRDALVSGLGLAGCRMWNAGELPAVALRYGVGALGAAGGLHVSSGPDGRCVIRLFGEDGVDLPRAATRLLERNLGNEDFRRADPEKVGEARYMPGVGEAYLAHIEERGRNLARRGLVLLGAHANPWLESRSRDFWRALDVGLVAVPTGLDPTVKAAEIRKNEALFAFEVDAAGETVSLTDNLGRPLSRAQAWLVLSLAAAVRDGTPLAVPGDLPRAVAERLAALGARPVPCRASKPELMARMATLEKEAGPGLFRQSEMIYGGLLGVVGLADYLVDAERTLAEMVDESPLGEWVHLRVRCPWDVKGRVMRLLMEESAGAAAVPAAAPSPPTACPPIAGAPGGPTSAPAAATPAAAPPVATAGPLEGIEAVAGAGRIVVLPDADRPAFHVYSEAPDLELAEELAGLYARRVTELAGLEDSARIPPATS